MKLTSQTIQFSVPWILALLCCCLHFLLLQSLNLLLEQLGSLNSLVTALDELRYIVKLFNQSF